MLSAQRHWRCASLRSFGSHCVRLSSSACTDSHNAIVHRDNVSFEKEDGGHDAHTGSLKGRIIAVKDNIVTRSSPTTAASKILREYRTPFDATVVRLLERNGAIVSTKTNLDEFGMGSHSQNSHDGAVTGIYSRHGVPLSPGGSSGGSALAVATGQCWAALGTDTGGSVRLPAAYTGIVGFKPSYGLLSRWGVIQYANSLDTVGILADNVGTVRDVFRTLNHYDPSDPTSLPESVRQRITHRAPRVVDSLRIGVPLEYNIAELSGTVKAAYLATLVRLQERGHELVPLTLSSTRQALSAYYVLAPAEASSNLAKYDGIRYGFRSSGKDASPSESLPLYAKLRGEAFGDEVKRRILLGAYTLSSEAMDNYFLQAQKIRRLVQRDFDGAFRRANPLLDSEAPAGGVDVLVTPTAPTLPPTVDEVKKATPVESYMNDVFTVPASLAGLPAISVPVSLPESARTALEDSDVSSVGIQVIGQFGDDELVLRAAEVVLSND